MILRRPILMLVLGAGLRLGAEEALAPEVHARMAEALAPSLVRVEYTLQYDKGEPPKGGQGGEWCPNCGRHHGQSSEDLVQDERPLETSGFLLSPTRVAAADPLLHPRFIRQVAVRWGDRTVAARPSAWARGQKAVFLDLAEPLPGTVPLAFAADAPAPYRAVTYQNLNGAWTVGAQPLSGLVSVEGKDRRFSSAPPASLIVDLKGSSVAVSMDGELPVDGSWKGSPAQWPAVAADALGKQLEALESATRRGLPRVELRFRSPKAQPGAMHRRFSSRDDADEAAERHVLGLLLDDRQILVLANLKKSATARLERIRVHPPQGEAVHAQFGRTLADFGAFVAVLEKSMEGAPGFSDHRISEVRRTLLLAAEITVQGEKRVAYFNRSRLDSFHVGRRGRLYPDVPGEPQALFLFDPQGALLALPVSRRERVEDERSHWRSNRLELVPAAYVREALADSPANADPNNVPLTEKEEHRIGWMGVELQALNKDLARANGVSELSRDGEVGALISFVYPDSPAQQAGIEPGVILLRLHIEGMPKPVDVKVEDAPFSRNPFPWDRLDQLPEASFDRVPTPWAPVENAFTRLLTDLGFGKKFKAELFRNGQVVFKDFEVVQSPPHYDAAPKIKADALGLTVRDLTFDVRRYFHMDAADPGVVISKIEPGSKASVAGLKPYEVVTAVNDVPVRTAVEFGKQIEGQGEVRLSIKRMTRSRQVKIQLGTPANGKDEEKKEGPK